MPLSAVISTDRAAIHRNILAAGYEQTLAQRAKTAKAVRVKYDADVRPGKTNRVERTFRLETRQASGTGKTFDLGLIYTFRIDPATTLLKLTEGN